MADSIIGSAAVSSERLLRISIIHCAPSNEYVACPDLEFDVATRMMVAPQSFGDEGLPEYGREILNA